MARPLRLELAGGLYHITSRGDGREDIYRTDADRNTWLTVRGQVCQRFNWVRTTTGTDHGLKAEPVLS